MQKLKSWNNEVLVSHVWSTAKYYYKYYQLMAYDCSAIKTNVSALCSWQLCIIYRQNISVDNIIIPKFHLCFPAWYHVGTQYLHKIHDCYSLVPHSHVFFHCL